MKFIIIFITVFSFSTQAGLAQFKDSRVRTRKDSRSNDRTVTRQQQILQHLKNPSKNYVLAVSHRGAWTEAPENSLLAIQKCIDMGVDIVEIDVRLTKDGHLVLMHDRTVDRTTNGTGKVEDLTLAEIRQLRLKNAVGVEWSTQTVPTLTEAMLLAKNKIMMNLDKVESITVREAYAVLKKTETIDHAIFKGNDSVQVMRAKYNTLMDSILYMPKVWYNLRDIPSYVEDFDSDLHPVAYEMIFDKTSSPVFGQINAMRKRNTTVLAIALWDALCAGYSDELAAVEGPEKAYGWLINHGANAIMTDNPAMLLAFLRQRKVHD